MEFTQTFKFTTSYYLYFILLFATGFSLYVSYYEPVFLFMTLGIVLFSIYFFWYMKNRVFVAVSEDGITLWKARKQYLFCSWKEIQKIEFRKMYHHKTGYFVDIDMEYGSGRLLELKDWEQFASHTQCQIKTSRASLGNHFYVRYPNIDTEHVAREIKALWRNYGSSQVNRHLRNTFITFTK